jgi:hypothetical protein
MDNQHRKITGYRELSEAEIGAMNRIKDLAAQVGHLMDELGQASSIDKRAVAIARTELQTGFMWAVRAIAQPTSF